MEIKLFGRSLFKFSKAEAYFQNVNATIKETKFLPDFYKRSFGGNLPTSTENWIVSETYTGMIATNPNSQAPVKKEEKKEVPKADRLTPKGVYTLQMLNDKGFKLKTDPDYVNEMVGTFKDKLALIKSEEHDMRNGVQEVASVLMRFENRKKYTEHKAFFEEFPYTTTTKIDELVKAHSYLKIDQVAEFIADMPKEATDVMKNYNKITDKICGKQAVFYIIADKDDFKKTEKRRDPILLAQSPFGHFWQILGAWDKEMMFIEEL
jgi:hypothetical protein